MFISIFNICVKYIEPYNIHPFFGWVWWFQKLGKNLPTSLHEAMHSAKDFRDPTKFKGGWLFFLGFLRIFEEFFGEFWVVLWGVLRKSLGTFGWFFGEFWRILWGVLGDSLGSFGWFFGGICLSKNGDFFWVIPLDFVGILFGRGGGGTKNTQWFLFTKKHGKVFFRSKTPGFIEYIDIFLNRRIKLMLWVFLFVKWVFPKIGVPQNGWKPY